MFWFRALVAAAQLNEAGLEAIGELLKGDAVDQMVKYAISIEADLIMLGHKRHGNWLERWWRRSTPKALIEHLKCFGSHHQIN